MGRQCVARLVNSAGHRKLPYHAPLCRSAAARCASALNSCHHRDVPVNSIRSIGTSEAEQLARQSDDRPGLAEMYMIRCMVCLSTADFDGATKYLGDSVEAGRQLEIKELMAFGLAHLANTLIYLTRFDEAWETAQNCLRVSREIGDRAHVADVLAQPITYYHLRQGDLAAAQQSAEESARIAAPIGYAMGEAAANLMLALILRERGAFQQAHEASQRALAAAQVVGHPLFIAMALSQVGTALLNISATFDQDIVAVHTQAAQLLEIPIGLPAGGSVWVELGFCVLARPDRSGA
jgi:tetratricopeptide (TPR) repeat protein